MALVPKTSFLNQMNIMISKREKSLVPSLAQLLVLFVSLFSVIAIAKDRGIFAINDNSYGTFSIKKYHKVRITT